jgi:hypothetical protein
MYVSASEMSELKDELMDVLVRYQDRDKDPGRRPAAARQARVFFSTFVDPPR